MTSNSRPTANITSLKVNGSRWPAERLVVRRTPLATARILPTSREYSVTMRSASPRPMRFRMTAGVRYRRCLVTALAGQHTWQGLDEHAAGGGDGVRLAFDRDRVAGFESACREIGDDAALQLAAKAVGGEHVSDNEEVGTRRRRGRLGCLCGWRRL